MIVLPFILFTTASKGLGHSCPRVLVRNGQRERSHVLSPERKHFAFPCEVKNRDLRMRLLKKCVWGGRAEPESTQKVGGMVCLAHTTPALVMTDPEGSDRGREGKHRGSNQSVGLVRAVQAADFPVC